MKKLFLFAAILFIAFPAFAQDNQEEDYNYSDISVIGRLDLNPYYSLSPNKLSFSHANSALYTVFEGRKTEHFSYIVINHWIHAGGDYGWPYTSLGRSDTTNWLDFCNMTFSFSNWDFTVGKDMLNAGTFEYEDWDWDVHYSFTSALWNSLPAYQWGIKAAYTFNSENTTLSAQMTTSPYGERPFASNLWQWSARWDGQYGWFSNKWGVSYIQGLDRNDILITLGNRFTINDYLTLDLDWNTYCGNTIMAKCQYTPSDKWSWKLKASYASVDLGPEEDILKGFRVGVDADYYPLKESDRMRLFASFVYDGVTDVLNFNAGIRYNLLIHIR